MQTSPSTIDIATVTKRFGAVTAVDNVSLNINRGEVLALLGPNGAGKTTLLDMVSGFTEPDTGTLNTLGQSPQRATSNGHVGAVLQDGGLLEDLTAAETNRMVAARHARPLPVAEVVHRAGIADFSNRKGKTWSGGQKQRLQVGL